MVWRIFRSNTGELGEMGVQNIGLDKGCEKVLNKQFIMVVFANFVHITMMYINVIVI
jgi:hypothetical protein